MCGVRAIAEPAIAEVRKFHKMCKWQWTRWDKLWRTGAGAGAHTLIHPFHKFCVVPYGRTNVERCFILDAVNEEKSFTVIYPG